MKEIMKGTNSCDEFDWDDINYSVDVKGKFFKATVENFGWQKLGGVAFIKANNMTEILTSILPNAECSFTIYSKGKQIIVKNTHHDSTSGDETYTIKPIAESTYLKSK